MVKPTGFVLVEVRHHRRGRPDHRSVEVVLRGGHRLRIHGAVDAGVVHALVSALARRGRQC